MSRFDHLLRVLFIVLLLAILSMQILFLYQKHLSQNNRNSVESKAIISRDSIAPDTLNLEKKLTVSKAPEHNNIVRKTVKDSTKTKVVYEVISNKCIGCRLCVINCPVNAITMEGSVAVIDKDKCISCGICKDGDNDEFAGCPVNAITAK